MLVNSVKAALLAAIVTLTGNVVWAQKDCPCPAKQPVTTSSFISYGQTKCEPAKGCCAAGSCCKDSKCGSCGKEAKCACCAEGKCCTVADKKCECGKGEKCCCGKKCDCGKTCACAKEKSCCCAISSEMKPHTIIVFVPMPHPTMIARCPGEPIGMLPPPPMMTPPGLPVPPVMPPQTVGMPVPPAPPGCYGCPVPTTSPVCPACPTAAAPICYPATPATAYPCPTAACPVCPQIGERIGAPICLETAPVLSKCNESAIDYGLSMLSAACEMALMSRCDLPSLCLTTLMSRLSPTGYCEEAKILPPPTREAVACCPVCPTMTATVPCATCAPKAECKMCVVAKSDSPRLESSNGNGNACSFKRMTVKVGEDEITLSRFDDRVRVRGSELKATAERVRIDRSNCLILEGGVTLHYKRDGQSANVTGEHIELNLTTGTLTIKGTGAIKSAAN